MYQPNGSGTFTEINITEDKVRVSGVAANQQAMFFWDVAANGIRARYMSKLYSGSAQPTDLTSATWYDTENNQIKFYGNNTLDSSSGCLPLCLGTSDSNNTIISIDQIFNGFCYIGSTVFALPGIKCLIPNGRNEDGSLKNDLGITTIVKTITYSLDTTDVHFGMDSNGNIGINGAYTYNEKENMQYLSNNIWRCSDCGTYKISNGKIINFRLKNTFCSLDYNDKSDISGWGMPSNKYIDLTLGASGTTYTAPANGWFTIRYDSTNNGYCSLTNATANLQSVSQGAINCLQTPCKKGDVMNVDYTANVFYFFRFIYTEGEQ